MPEYQLGPGKRLALALILTGEDEFLLDRLFPVHRSELLVHAIGELIRGLEGDDEPVGQPEFLVRPRVPGHARGSMQDLEGAEPPDLDPAMFERGVDDPVQYRLDRFAGLTRIQMEITGQLSNDVPLGSDIGVGHNVPPFLQNNLYPIMI